MFKEDPEPDFPIGLRGLSLGPRGKGGPAVQSPPLGKRGGQGRKRKNKSSKDCTWSALPDALQDTGVNFNTS